jgi:chromosome partitioning protein
MKSITFFNNKGGVGKTSLVYHLGWMFSELGYTTLMADLDPQANLTAMCLDDDTVLNLLESKPVKTIQTALSPVIKGTGEVKLPHIEELNPKLFLIPGDLTLSKFEDSLSETWPKCLSTDERAFRVQLAFYHCIQLAAKEKKAEVILIDVGPNLGAINRSALIASDFVILPVAPDLYSIKGIENLGPTLKEWKQQWAERLSKKPEDVDFLFPEGTINPLGYIVMNPSIRSNRPAKAYQRWMDKVPEIYREKVLASQEPSPSLENDPYRLDTLRHYQSLMPLAMERNKPMFKLQVADGAIGAHSQAVERCRVEFETLARKIISLLS